MPRRASGLNSGAMKLFRVFLLLSLPLAAFVAAPSSAQPQPGINQKSPPAKTKRAQKKQLDRAQQLDGLFAALKAAPIRP